LKIKNSLQYLIVLYIYIFNHFYSFLIKKNAQKRSKHSLRYAINKPKTISFHVAVSFFFFKILRPQEMQLRMKKSNPRIFCNCNFKFGETQKIKNLDAFKLIENVFLKINIIAQVGYIFFSISLKIVNFAICLVLRQGT
jgi:hypothetical protein